LPTTVGASHIHVGQSKVNGGVTVFFCGGGGRPACPLQGTVEGDFSANDVIGLTSQQLEPTNLAKLLSAIRAGETYANVHTATSPGGEMRGQIHAEKEKKEE
jgi:CHRD domain